MPGLYGVMGLLLAVIPQLTVCPVTEIGYMRCWETAKAMLFLGAVIVIAGAALIFAKKTAMRIGIHSFSAMLSLIGIMIPLKLIGGCMEQTMVCHAVAFPIIYVMLTVTICISVCGIICNILEIKDYASGLKSA